MNKKRFLIGNRVCVDECYLNDEVTQFTETTQQATIQSEPSDDEELVCILYDSGILDFVPQDILENC